MVSSIDVYRNYDVLRGKEDGPPDAAPLREDSPLRSRLYPYRDPEDADPHALNNVYDKILAERAYLSDPTLPGTVLRLPFVYGPGDYQHRLHTYLKRMDDKRPVILFSQEASKLARGPLLRGKRGPRRHAGRRRTTRRQTAFTTWPNRKAIRNTSGPRRSPASPGGRGK